MTTFNKVFVFLALLALLALSTANPMARRVLSEQEEVAEDLAMEQDWGESEEASFLEMDVRVDNLSD